MKKTLLLIAILGSFITVIAQIKPIVTKAKYVDKTPPLREMELVVPGIRDRSWKDNVIENKLEFPGASDEYKDSGPDPVWQYKFGKQKHNEPIQNFDGTGNVNGVMPPDTDGDVGPNHYFQIVNMSFQIFDKEGNSLYGPADNSTLWDGLIGPWTGHNDGDPIVAYDELADRWVVSQFALECTGNTYWEMVAVSATPDPLGSWYRYAFEYPVFNDYPKLSVWPDAYYCSFNLFGDDYTRVGASAYEREAMLIGDTNARHVLFDLPPEELTWSMLPADFDGNPPPEGAPCYWVMGTDDDNGVHEADQIWLWEFNVDWNDPENSTFEKVKEMDTEPFNYDICGAGGLMNCIPQPDGAPMLDALSAYVMQPLQYRNFGTYETMVFNHTVNADGNGLAGIRWYELRKENDEEGWYIYQQGTYAPDENCRWMGSIAMDARGYIALGYTVSSTSVYPSLRYTGRSPDSPLGEMTFTEEEIIAGGGVQTGDPHRWGDYSMMAVDPSNDTTFWYTGEYMATTSGWGWSTRIASFNLTIDETPPAAISDLQAQNTSTNAIQLNWTATGNDGTEGTANYYQIRYANYPISESNWESVIVVENEIMPAASGTNETFTAEGLEYNTEYYFAVKAGDKQNNISGVSNSASGTVAGPPILALDETAVEVKIFKPGLVHRPYTISNTGETDVNYKFYKEIVEIPENVGKILDTLEYGTIFNTGMTWSNGYLYITDRWRNYLYKYDTTLQIKVDSFSVHIEPIGLCWDGNYFWIGDKNGLIRAYNPDGTPAGLSFSCPFSHASALAYSGKYFIVSESKTNPKIYFLDQQGNEITTYKTKLKFAPTYFAWAENHYGCNLWYTNANSTIRQLCFIGDSAIVSKSFEGSGNSDAVIAYDGSDLWQNADLSSLYRIDDGIDEIPWFKMVPDEGRVVASASEEIILQADLTMLPEMDTSTMVNLKSNDPLNNSIFVPVQFAYTTIDLGADTSFCSERNIFLDAGDGFKEYVWSDGTGEQTLLVDSTAYGLGSFAVWAEVLDYADGTSRDTILITFEDCTGIEEGKILSDLQIFPNPVGNELTLKMTTQSQQSIEVSLFSITGNELQNYDYGIQLPAKQNFSIPTNQLNPGIYFLRLQIGNEVVTKKVVKL